MGRASLFLSDVLIIAQTGRGITGGGRFSLGGGRLCGEGGEGGRLGFILFRVILPGTGAGRTGMQWGANGFMSMADFLT